MKARLFRVVKTAAASFQVQEDDMAHFYDQLHFHPEFQLTYIMEGEGTLFVGDGIHRFGPGQVLLLGSNLPHVLRNDEEWYAPGSALKARAISIYFNLDAFGSAFFQLPELRLVQQLLARAGRGLVFDAADQHIVEAFAHLPGKVDFERMLSLFQLLHRLSKEQTVSELSSMVWVTPLKDADHIRINAVFSYIMENFHDTIRLEDVAAIAHLSPTAFCRFFKNRTRKTFSNFLAEIRIGQACRLLLEDDYQVSEIAWKCGYRNLSNFNRQFKSLKGYAPVQWLQLHNSLNEPESVLVD